MREEEKKTSQKSTIQRILKKRWAMPAIYIGSAAIVLSLAFWMQSSYDQSTDKKGEKTAETAKDFNQPAVEVNSKLESIKMPVADASSVVIKKNFYDKNADKDEQAAALVFYNNRYEPNKGIDVAAKDGKTFEVAASLSGTVTKVEEDSLNGNLVEIKHDDGVVTRYQSITDIKVKAGDTVKQGEAVASAGQSLINEKAGVHVHFEIRKDGTAVNPVDYFDKQLSDIPAAADESANTENEGTQDKQAADESAATDEKSDQTEKDQTDKNSDAGKDEKADETDDAGQADDGADASDTDNN